MRSAIPTRRTIGWIAILGASALLAAAPLSAYVICGLHDSRFHMRAYFFNSEFWVNMLVDEARKWNDVHPVLSIDRTRSRTAPIGRDGENVIVWIGEADLKIAYNMTWTGFAGYTSIWEQATCGRYLEADMLFNPTAITLFTLQTQTPYKLGFHEVALHELGHAVTLDHENDNLAVMTDNANVSNVLHHNDKVGWIRSAARGFNPLPTPREDMGVFPLRNTSTGKTFASISPSVVARGASVTIRDFTVENLSSVFPYSQPGPAFLVVLERTPDWSLVDIGWFSWDSFPAFSEWAGNLTFTVPASVVPGQYRVAARFKGVDSDSTNNRAVFGTVTVR